LSTRSHTVAKLVVCDDLAFDFDMAIYKAPNTNTDVPWHQDEGCWIEMPDKRALSVWTAIDDAIVDNGCMWFWPKSHKKGLYDHVPVREGEHVLMVPKDKLPHHTLPEPVARPIKAGSCTFHGGRALHHTRGNITEQPRRGNIKSSYLLHVY